MSIDYSTPKEVDSNSYLLIMATYIDTLAKSIVWK